MSSFNPPRIPSPGFLPGIFSNRQDYRPGESRGNRSTGRFIPALFPDPEPCYQMPACLLFPLFPICSRSMGTKVKCFVPFVPPLYKGGTKEQITEEPK